MNPTATVVDAARIAQAHQLYCQLTGQCLSLRYDRERAWFELLRTGVTLEQLAHLVRYFQREIRHGRRNVGALKLSNLLQPDRFEEDLALSRIALHPPTRPPRRLSLRLSRSLPRWTLSTSVKAFVCSRPPCVESTRVPRPTSPPSPCHSSHPFPCITKTSFLNSVTRNSYHRPAALCSAC